MIQGTCKDCGRFEFLTPTGLCLECVEFKKGDELSNFFEDEGNCAIHHETIENLRYLPEEIVLDIFRDWCNKHNIDIKIEEV